MTSGRKEVSSVAASLLQLPHSEALASARAAATAERRGSTVLSLCIHLSSSRPSACEDSRERDGGWLGDGSVGGRPVGGAAACAACMCVAGLGCSCLTWRGRC